MAVNGKGPTVPRAQLFETGQVRDYHHFTRGKAGTPSGVWETSILGNWLLYDRGMVESTNHMKPEISKGWEVENYELQLQEMYNTAKEGKQKEIL